jgi:hypothetical protein
MKFEIINYDVWGNPTDGFEVNDSYRTDLFINIEESDTDKEILKKLKEVGFLKNTAKFKCFEIEGEHEYTLYINHVSAKNGLYPFCELRKVENEVD